MGCGVLHLDFANAWIGGGVLGNGSVQEEIRFLICPELIVSRLLCERMEPNEAILMQGFERFSCYGGYARTFTCAEPYDDIPDPSRRPALIAIDATRYQHSDPLRQFRHAELERELNKALAGFTPPADHSTDNPFASSASSSASSASSSSAAALAPCYATMPLCTGNWGCGAFEVTFSSKRSSSSSPPPPPDVLACTISPSEMTTSRSSSAGSSDGFVPSGARVASWQRCSRRSSRGSSRPTLQGAARRATRQCLPLHPRPHRHARADSSHATSTRTR